MSKLIKLKIEDVPTLPRHAKLRFDNARKKWIINAPERVFELDDIAGEVMQLINGKDTLKQIIDKLLVKYEDAPSEQVTDDVKSFSFSFCRPPYKSSALLLTRPA